MDGLCQFKETGDIVVVVDAKLCRSVGAFRGIHAGIFHHDKTGAAFGALLVIINMEETHLSALFTVVRPHGCHHDPVFQCHAADSERFKNVSVLFFHNS